MEANQETQIPEQTPVLTESPQTISKPNDMQWLKMLSIGFAIISVCISLGIGGYILSSRKTLQKRSFSPTITQAPTPAINPKANWKMYTDNVLGISFQYPSNWILGGVRKDPNDTGSEEVLFQAGKNEIHVSVEADPQNLDYAAFQKQQFPQMPDLYTNISYKDVVIIHGVTFKQVLTPPSAIIYGIYNKRMYAFAIESIIAEPSTEDIAILKQAVSTIKFADQNQVIDISSWQTYTDSSGKFSLQYPRSWILTMTHIGTESDKKDIRIAGKEGKVDIIWVRSYGGACPPEYEKINLENEILPVCHETFSGIESWSQITKQLPSQNDPALGITINAQANVPSDINRNTILQILSTLQFLK